VIRQATLCTDFRVKKGDYESDGNCWAQRLDANSQKCATNWPQHQSIGNSWRIVAAYIRQDQIGLDQLQVLISTVHQALVALSKPTAEIGVERTPAVSIQRSVHRDYVVCLDCGWRGKMLRRHLATGHRLTVEQ
jgi:predicted transcriptional regulator